MQRDLRDPAVKSRERAGAAVHEAPIAGGDWRMWARALGVAAAAGVFLALIGAYGTQGAFAERALYWVPSMVIASAIGLLALRASRYAFKRAPAWLNHSPFAFLAAGVVLMTPPITLWVWFYSARYFGAAAAHVTLLDYLPGVATISAAMTFVFYLLYRPATLTHAAPAGAAPSRFLERLPAKLKGGVLYAIEAEDHYLRLHTSKGADLILMRLADAISELEGLEGAQTHRSWWVAKAAVAEVKRQDGKVTLRLTNGIEAPVSRANLKPLREAGWL